MIGIVEPYRGISKTFTHINVLYRAVKFANKKITAGTERNKNCNKVKVTKPLAHRTTLCSQHK